MSTETIDYLAVIAHLPTGATLRLPCGSYRSKSEGREFEN